MLFFFTVALLQMTPSKNPRDPCRRQNTPKVSLELRDPRLPAMENTYLCQWSLHAPLFPIESFKTVALVQVEASVRRVVTGIWDIDTAIGLDRGSGCACTLPVWIYAFEIDRHSDSVLVP